MCTFVIDVAFSVTGDYAAYEEIPYEVMIAALQKRVNDLQTQADDEAFSCEFVSPA